VDLKRQGRAEEHIALFYPETPIERRALLRAMQKKSSMPAFSADLEQFFLDNAGSLSGADIEAVLVRSRMRATLRNKSVVEAEDIKGALEDFIPPSYPTEIDLQNIVAVLECTSKSLLPKQWRDADRKELIQKANELLAFTRASGEG
jgi:SpoVK/Ycf46/Vps4 family AAA+-type ATPase